MANSYSQLRKLVEDYTPYLLNCDTLSSRLIGSKPLAPHITWYGTAMCRFHRLAMVALIDRDRITARYCIICDRNLLEIGIRLEWIKGLIV